MGLASSGFSPLDDHWNDEKAWESALYPARLYEAVVAEAKSGVQPRPIWRAVLEEVQDLLHWAAGPRALRGGHQLLYQTADSRWHWNQSAVSDYDVMHAWAVDGRVFGESERTSTDGGTPTNHSNGSSGGNGGRGSEQNGSDEGVQAVTEIRTALFQAAELCDKNQEEGLRYALVLVEGPRRRIREDMWNWGH